MTRPSFSIVTPTFNQGPHLGALIESVLAQTNCGSIQHIIVDGGSTDGTLEILAQYPHLTVVRENFLFQSEALNIGFSLASGEIVSWLSPPDRYARGALALVAQEIERHPVVLGGVGICDARGVVVQQVDNVERTWFDTIKYWVLNAIPVQPAVFFKRSILNELEIEPGEVFDQSLFWAFDFDLWLRIQERHPFSLRISELLAYRPQSALVDSASDRSGRAGEMSRIFRRHSSRRIQPEQRLSFVVPVTEPLTHLKNFLDSLQAQSVSGLEVVIVDRSQNSEGSQPVMSSVWACGARNRALQFQYVPMPDESKLSLAAAFDAGVRSARSEFVSCLASPRALPTTFAADVLKAFARDEVGLVLPSLDDDMASKLFVSKHGTQIFNPAGPFSLCSGSQMECVVRKLAWIDSGGFSLHDRFPEMEFSIRRLLVMAAHRAWRIVSEPLLKPLMPPSSNREEPFRLYENSVIVDEIAREMRRNPFSILRAKLGFGLVLSEDLWQCAQSVMRLMPDGGTQALAALPRNELERLVEGVPQHGPTLYCLAHALEREGLSLDAADVLARWRVVYRAERSSPLFGGITKPTISNTR